MSLKLVPAGTHIDFISKRRICALLSIAVIVASAIATQVMGVRLGIDFAGGTEMLVRFDTLESDEGRLRDLVSAVPGVENLSVVRYGDASDREFLLKFMGSLTPAGEGVSELAATPDGEPPEDLISLIVTSLQDGVGPLEVQRVDFVGPRVGAELRDDGLQALFWASIVILVYVAIRFSLRFAPGAIVAVAHDLLVTAGIFVMLGMEFDLRILAAMLAILGYSLNDTIIIYDRIRENMELHTKVDLPEVLNQSVNQTLSRTVLTSGTTLVALLSLFLLGGDVIRPFALAMLIGVVVGTYSSVYIAAPVLLLLEERFGDKRSGASKGRKSTATA